MAKNEVELTERLIEPVKEEEVKKREKELKEKYGVIEEIPEREVEEDVETTGFSSAEIKEMSLPNLLLRIEKIDGKLEMLEDFKKGIDERISQLSENVGELRSTILEKEKFLSKVEKDMEMVLETVSGLQPEKIKKQFLKRDSEIEEIKASIEKHEEMIRELRSEVKEFLNMMERIKSIDNLLKTSEKIETKISKIEEAKAYTEKIAAKVELIFSELSEKLNELERQKEQINKIDELTTDIVKMLDEISLKMVKFAEKEYVEKLKEEINKRLERIGQGEIKIKEREKKEDEWERLKEKWKNKLVKQQALIASG